MTKLEAAIKIVRPLNLLIIIATLTIIRYKTGLQQLSEFNFFLLLLGCCLITAAGNIINDIFDSEIDKVNKPHKYYIDILDIGSLYKVYLLLNSIGLLIGGFLGVIPFIFFGTAILLLYFYSKTFKCKPLIGNLIVAILCAAIIQLFLWIEYDGITRHWRFLLFFYTFFAFQTTLIRELVKDLQDRVGDATVNCQTFPLKYGVQKTATLFYILLSILGTIILLFSFYIWNLNNYLLTSYIWIVLLLPLFIFGIKVPLHTNNFQIWSSSIKAYFLLGLIMLLLF